MAFGLVVVVNRYATTCVEFTDRHRQLNIYNFISRLGRNLSEHPGNLNMNIRKLDLTCLASDKEKLPASDGTSPKTDV